MRLIDPQLIGSIFSGLVLLVGALATYTASRSRRIGEDQRALRRQYRGLQRRFLAAAGHIFRLETELAERGILVPTRPGELDDDGDDEDRPLVPPVLPPPPPAQRHERHRRDDDYGATSD